MDNINANDLLIKDHREVEATYEKYLKAEEGQKKFLAKKILIELTVHAELEEKFYYPELENAGEKELVDEFRSEHEEVKNLIEKMASMNPENPEYDALLKNLMDATMQHATEEEAEALPEMEALLGKEKLQEIAIEMIDERDILRDAASERLWPTS